MNIRTTALALTLVAALSACANDPEPRIADPTSEPPNTSVAPTSSPTEATTTPAEPERKESPVAFLRRWIAVSDEMNLTGDPSEFLSLSMNCLACEKVASEVETLYSNGGRVEFKGSELKTFEVDGTSRRDATIHFKVEVSASKIYSGDGSPPQVYSAGLQPAVIYLVRRKGEWFVTAYSRTP